MEIKTAIRIGILFVLTGGGHIVIPSVYGASVGSIDNPGFNLSVGADHSSRAMAADDDEVDLGAFANTRVHGTNTIERVTLKFDQGEETIDRVYVRAAYGIKRYGLERLGLFGRGGVARHRVELFGVTLRDQVEDTAFFGSNTDIIGVGDLSGRGKLGPFWGAGGQAFLKQGRFRVGLKIEYLFHQSDAEYLLTETGAATLDPIGQTVSSTLAVRADETKTREIQGALILSVLLKSYTSYYGGIKYSWVNTQYTGTALRIERDDTATPRILEQQNEYRFKTTSQNATGFFAGAVYRITPSIELNMEVRVGDEVGMTVQIGHPF